MNENVTPTKDYHVRIYFKNGMVKAGFININGFTRLSDYLQQHSMINGYIKLYGDGNKPIIIPVDSINYYEPQEKE